MSRTSLPKSKSLLEKDHKPQGKASEHQTANPPFNHNTRPYYLSHSEQSMLYLKNAFQIERFLKSGFPRTAVACTRNNLCSTFIHNSQSQNSSGFWCSSSNLTHAISIFCHWVHQSFNVSFNIKLCDSVKQVSQLRNWNWDSKGLSKARLRGRVLSPKIYFFNFK